MVKKLFKHELFALGRVLLIMQGILLAAAVFLRVLQFFESEHLVYSIVFFFAALLYGVAVFVNSMAPLVMAVVRYYRNLFTAEGYLSFSLPVTASQHLMVKALGALVFQVVSWVVTALSLVIVMAGDVLHEVGLAAAYLFKQIPADVSGNMFLWGFELLLIFAVSFLSQVFLYYGCVSIGQLSRKNRVLFAVGVYFAYYVATQVLGTVLTVLVAVLGDHIPFDILAEFMEAHPIAFVHLFLCGMLLLTVVFTVAYFFVSHAIIRKRLNLE